METVNNLISYIIKSAPGPAYKFYLILIPLTGLLLLAAIFFAIIYKKKKKDDFAFKRLFKKLPQRLILFSILFIFFVLVRYENIPYFSMRLWVFLGFILFIFFIYKSLKAYFVTYPKEKENVSNIFSKNSQKIENKYLPNKKRGKTLF